MKTREELVSDIDKTYQVWYKTYQVWLKDYKALDKAEQECEKACQDRNKAKQALKDFDELNSPKQ